MSIKCAKCPTIIEDGDGCYNYPSGTECNDCGDPKTRKNPKTVNIAGYEISFKLLQQYLDKVEFTRRAGLMGHARDDPLIVMQALQDRVKIHKEIFKVAGIDHEDTGKKATKIREALEKWLEKNTLTQKHKEDWS